MKYDVNDYTKTLPGDVVFTKVGMPGVITIKIGQSFVGDDDRYHHTAIAIGEDMLMEARPPQARIVGIDPNHSSIWYRLPLTDEQRDDIHHSSRAFFKIGVIKYHWMVYPWIGMLHLGMSPQRFRQALLKSDRRICSQMVDEQLTDVGYHLFNDNRSYLDVTPGDIRYRLSSDPSVTPFRLDGKDPWYWEGK